jgi:hypothetical protein
VNDEPREEPLFADDEDAVFDPLDQVEEDPYVAHETPTIGTERNRRLFLFGVLPIVAIVVAGLVYFLVR